jgi:glycosyltransferase involved in cell wall biosynthesis
MTTPTVSVVIPLFNKEHSIIRAIDSVLVQSFENFELIVVDDGSTDGSVDSIKHIANPRLKLVSQTNQGAAAARNYGVNIATADHVAFLDADDCYQPHFLQKIADLIALNANAVLFCCRIQFIDENSQLFRPGGVSNKDFKGELTNFVELFTNDRALIHPSAMAVNKVAFVKVGRFPQAKHVGEDLQLILSLAIYGQVMHDNYCGATVFRNAENRTKDRKLQEISCHISYFLGGSNWQQTASVQDVIAVQRFCCKSAVLHSAGAVLNGQRGHAWSYLRIVWRFSLRQAVMIAIISCCPVTVLQWVKDKRNAVNSDG